MRSVLIDLGGASLETFWLPVLAWTVLALLAEVTLRALRPSARMGLATRGSLVALLPLGIIGPPLLARWVPSIRTAEPLASLPTPPLAAAPPETITNPLATLPSATPEAIITGAPSMDWTALAMGGATVSAAVVSTLALLVLAGGLVWIARYRQRLRAAAKPVRDEAAGLSRRMGVTRRVQIAVVDDAVSPFTVGLWRPLVALPKDLAPEARQFALAHELAHVRDAHFGWAVGERLVRAAFVWHPLVHLLGRGLALDREREADAAVLRLWPERAAEYGRLLHALSTRPSPRFALGASSSHLLSRLHAMTHSTPERRRLAWITGALLLALPLLIASAVLPDAMQAPPPPTAPALLATATPLAPEAPSSASLSAGAEAEPRDSLDQYIWLAEVRYIDEVQNVRLRLAHDASRRTAAAIAAYYEDGDGRGTLEVVGLGFTLTRSTIREDAFPPPPPLPTVADAPQNDATSLFRDRTTQSQAVLDQMDNLLSPSVLAPDARAARMQVVYLTEIDGTPRC